MSVQKQFTISSRVKRFYLLVMSIFVLICVMPLMWERTGLPSTITAKVSSQYVKKLLMCTSIFLTLKLVDSMLLVSTFEIASSRSGLPFKKKFILCFDVYNSHSICKIRMVDGWLRDLCHFIAINHASKNRILWNGTFITNKTSNWIKYINHMWPGITKLMDIIRVWSDRCDFNLCSWLHNILVWSISITKHMAIELL